MQKGKMVSEEALQMTEKRREAKGKGEKERYIHLNAEFQRITRRDKKVFFISCRDGHNKGQKQHGPNRSRIYKKR